MPWFTITIIGLILLPYVIILCFAALSSWLKIDVWNKFSTVWQDRLLKSFLYHGTASMAVVFLYLIFGPHPTRVRPRTAEEIVADAKSRTGIQIDHTTGVPVVPPGFFKQDHSQVEMPHHDSGNKLKLPRPLLIPPATPTPESKSTPR